MTNVLVFPAGTEVGLEIYRSLKDSKHFRIVPASSVPSHADYLYPYVHHLPFVDDPGFKEALKALVAQEDVSVVIPAHDDICGLIYDNDTAKSCRFKSITYQTFPEISPKVYPSRHISIEYPAFVKPSKGQGSKDCAIVRDAQELVAATHKNGMLTVEYLPGPEYTVDCFTDRHGVLRFCEGRIRGRTINGIAAETERAINPKFREFGELINGRLKFRGAWFFQVKEDKNGELKLLEIAPRIAGSSGLWRAHGVNLAELTLWDALEQDVEILFQDFPVRMSRALEERYKVDLPPFQDVYIDVDDTTIKGGKLNPEAIRIALHFYGQGKDIWFQSRNFHDNEILNQIGEFIRVPENHPKSKWMDVTKGAIFIDDSFAERKEVHDALGIPVFGLDAIDALLG